MTRRDSLEIFALLTAAYPREPMTEAQIALYETLLAPYPPDAVREAVLRHIQQSPWFPRISDLLALVTAGDTLDADEAWAEVRRQIRAVGYYGCPVWSHPAVAEAVAAIGWDTLCLSTNPEVDRAHFLRFYAAARQRTQAQQQFTALPATLRQALGTIGVPER